MILLCHALVRICHEFHLKNLSSSENGLVNTNTIERGEGGPTPIYWRRGWFSLDLYSSTFQHFIEQLVNLVFGDAVLVAVGGVGFAG